MPTTPTSLSFTYKKGQTNPPRQKVEYSLINPTFPDGQRVIHKTNHNWIHVDNKTLSSSEIGLVYVSTNELSPGTHEGEVSLYHEYINKTSDPNNPELREDLIGVVTVTLNLSEDPKTEARPTALTFEYLQGATLPIAQTIGISSVHSWNVSKSHNWVTLSKNSGVNDNNFDVSVIPSGLNNGTHSATITVNDGVNDLLIPVNLIITSTNNDFLYVNPNVLNFGYTLSGSLPSVKTIELNSSKDWNVIANKPWLNVSVQNGLAGPSNFDVGLKDIANLAEGNHTGLVSITNGTITKNVTVNLTVFVFAEELLSPNDIYFTDENNLIVVSSGRTETHLQIKVNSVYKLEVNKFYYDVPFFKGKAKKRIGLESSKIIGSQPLLNIDSVSLFNPYEPLNLNLDINEVSLYNSDITQTIHLQNIRFLKGVIPVNNWMSDTSKQIFVTSKAIVRFSFFNKDKSTFNKLTITGDKEVQFPFEDNNAMIQTVNIPLESLQLIPGNSIKLNVGLYSLEVFIKEPTKDHCMLFWENKWGCWDSFECTGTFKQSAKFKDTSFGFRKDYQHIETKVLNVQTTTLYQINTGYLYLESEAETLQKMLEAKSLYLLRDNKLIKVRSTTRKLVVKQTTNTLKEFKLTFENTII